VTVTESVRAFLAFEVPDAVRRRLAAERDALRRDLPAARWTRPEAWHLTLKFLGESDPQALTDLMVGLRGALPGVGTARAHLRGSGFFPHPANPRVAWLGGSISGVEPILEIIEGAATTCGLPREKRPWSLHLTLARLRARWPRTAVEHFLEWGERTDLGTFACSEVVLFKSTLQPGGAVYTALERIELQ
jgi:2'-5' RNA ligase